MDSVKLTIYNLQLGYRHRIIITCYLHFFILLYILCIRYISSYVGVIITNVIAGRTLVQSLAVAYIQ